MADPSILDATSEPPWVSEKESNMAWHQAKSDPEGVAASVTPAEAERSKDLEEGWEGEPWPQGSSSG